jgi:hypothetical protein
MKYYLSLLAAILLFSSPVAIAADSEPAEKSEAPWKPQEWNAQFSVYTKHFDPDPDHVNDQNLIGIETKFNNGYLAGFALFDNSFGQNSQFIYMGYSWPIMGSEHWNVKLLGGLLHGYEEPYEDKIPLNGLGIAPAIVPALEFRYRHFVAQANLGGLAVVTVNVGFWF